MFNPLKCARVKPRRSKNRFQAPNAALNLFEAKGPAKDVRENLLTAIQGTDRGVTCNEEKKKEILKLTEELAEIGKEQVTTGDSLSGTWKLAWTTEQVSNPHPQLSRPKHLPLPSYLHHFVNIVLI